MQGKQQLYVIQHIDRESLVDTITTGKHKLGVSNDPERRIEKLRSGTPHKLRLLTTVDVVGDSKRAEWLLHSIFHSSRYSKEWFRLSEGVITTFIDISELSVSDLEEVKRKMWMVLDNGIVRKNVPHWKVREDLFCNEVITDDPS